MSSRPRSLTQRHGSLGGSDAAAAVNLSRYKTPFQLWQEKLGLVEVPDLTDNESVRFGKLLEDVVAEEFSRRRGLNLRRDNRTLVHPTLPFLTAHIDRRVVGEREGLECKTANLRMAREWGEQDTDQVPEEYLAQSAHYMAVTGFVAWHVAVLIAGNDYRMYRIERDEELIERLVNAERKFWQFVEDKIPPPPATLDDAFAIWPHDTGGYVLATTEILTEAEKLQKLKKQQKLVEALIAETQLKIEVFMQTKTTLMATPTDKIATWATQQTRRVDVAMLREKHPDIAAACERVSETRVFRLK